MPARTVDLRAEPRTVLGKHVRRLRRAGIVPANIFGHGPSRAIQAPARALEQLLAQGARATVLAIALDGGERQTVLLKHVQRDPRSGHLLHVDFQAVSLNETVTSTVPLRFVGESPAVAHADGVMTHPLSQLQVEALARNLPEAIEVDLSALGQLHDAIHVADLKVPRVTILDPPEEVVAVVLPPKVAAEEVEAPAEEAPAAEAPEPTAE